MRTQGITGQLSPVSLCPKGRRRNLGEGRQEQILLPSAGCVQMGPSVPVQKRAVTALRACRKTGTHLSGQMSLQEKTHHHPSTSGTPAEWGSLGQCGDCTL